MRDKTRTPPQRQRTDAKRSKQPLSAATISRAARPFVRIAVLCCRPGPATQALGSLRTYGIPIAEQCGRPATPASAKGWVMLANTGQIVPIHGYCIST